MAEWIVSLDVRSPEAEDAVDLNRLADLAVALEKYEATAKGGGNAYGVVLKVEGDPRQALEAATDNFDTYREQVGLPGWPVVRCNLVEAGEFLHRLGDHRPQELAGIEEVSEMLAAAGDSEGLEYSVEVRRELELAGGIGLLGTREAVHMLGVTRERLRQLSTREDFPKPIARLAATPVWLASTVRAYAARRNTSPGRPAGWHRDTSSE